MFRSIVDRIKFTRLNIQEFIFTCAILLYSSQPPISLIGYYAPSKTKRISVFAVCQEVAISLVIVHQFVDHCISREF